jgi:molybdopterin converting factor small subunit
MSGQVSIRVPTILRTYTGGEAEVTVDPSKTDAGETLAGVLDALEAAYPGIRARILDDNGALRRFVNVYVGDEDVRFSEGLQTATPSGTQISVIPAVAGG